MKETDLQRLIACKFSEAGYGRLWINDNGLAFHRIGNEYRGFKYGLGTGSSDLIGFTKLNGQAVFTAIEVKLSGNYPTLIQEKYLSMVEMNGGVAGVARSWEDVEEIIKKARQ